MLATLLVGFGLTTHTGCVVDAPENLEALVVYGFEHFEDRPAYARATVEGILPQAAEVAEELTQGYRVDLLDAGHLEAAGIESAVTEGIVGALGEASYVSGLEDVVDVITRENKQELFESILDYQVASEGDRDCFVAGDCEYLVQEVDEVAAVALVGEATRRYRIVYRNITLEDGERVVVFRSLAPAGVEFSSGLLEVFQQYAFGVIHQRGGIARRLETNWVDADLGGLDVPDYFAVNLTVNSMQNQADRVDSVVGGE